MDRALIAPDPATATPPRRPLIDVGWRGPLSALGLALVAVLVIYLDTGASMVQIWRRSDTFAHGWVVVPISLWLIWRRRHALATMVSPPSYLGLAVIAFAGAGWLLADLASVASVAQFALVIMLQATVFTVLGWSAARTILFPLAFLFFAVPAGDFLVPYLTDWTASVTTMALRLTGIPVYRDGNDFILPTGAWSVVEACSGSRYLAASLMAGTLYAYLTYRSPRRRLAFVAASIVTPLIANWARAYMIVMIGHLTDGRFATGVDHLIYGWIFFGLVILLLFWIGSFWREDDAPDTAPSDVAARMPRPSVATGERNALLVAGAAVAAAAIWPVAAAMLDSAAVKEAPRLGAIAAAAGWRVRAEPLSSWLPRFTGARARLHQAFEKDGVGSVGIYLAYYRDQAVGSELVSFENRLTAPVDREWREVTQPPQLIAWGTSAVSARSSEVVGVRERLAVRRFYWVDGRLTASDYAAKARLAFAKLVGAGDSSAGIVIYTVTAEGAAEGEARLQRFAAEMGAAVDAVLRRAGGEIE